MDNVFIISGSGGKPCITLPSRSGLAQTLLQERDERLGRAVVVESEEEEAADDDE